MSIAEKLQTIAENEQKVYDSGYEDGLNSALPDYLPCVTSLKIPNWNLLGKKEVVLNIPSVTDYTGFMNQSPQNKTVEHLTINGAMDGTITRASMAFYSGGNETTLKRLTLNCDFSKCTTVSYMFNYLAALEVIDGQPLDFSSLNSIGNIHGCPLGSKLKEVRVVSFSIKGSIGFDNDDKLSNESKQSIFDGLATVETAQTLTLHSNLKILQSQVDSANAKGWNVAGGKVVSEEEYYG